MPYPDKPSPAAPRPADPESVYTTFLTTDIRPLIRSADPAELRAAHDAVAHLLRRYVTGNLSRHRLHPADLADDVHAIGLGVITAAALHRHAARDQAAHLLFHLWSNLDPGIGCIPRTVPFPPPGSDAIPLN